MMGKLKRKVLGPCRDVFVQEVSSMNVGVNSINSAPAEAILMRMFRLIEFFQDNFVKNFRDPRLNFFCTRLAGPILLGFIESVVRVVGEVEVACHNCEEFLSRLHVPDEALNALGSLLRATGGQVNAPDIQGAGIASKAEDCHCSVDDFFPRADTEFVEEIIFCNKSKPSSSFVHLVIRSI